MVTGYYASNIGMSFVDLTLSGAATGTLSRNLVRGLRHRGLMTGMNFMGAARMVAVAMKW
jgi:hypothetical protein